MQRFIQLEWLKAKLWNIKDIWHTVSYYTYIISFTNMFARWFLGGEHMIELEWCSCVRAVCVRALFLPTGFRVLKLCKICAHLNIAWVLLERSITFSVLDYSSVQIHTKAELRTLWNLFLYYNVNYIIQAANIPAPVQLFWNISKISEIQNVNLN